jgi:hypothetical protein
LALQGESWFTDRYVLEEGMYCSQTVVSRPRAITAVDFEMLEELPQKGNIEIFHEYFGWRPREARTAELEQQPEGITVSGYRMLARTQLR